MSDDLYIRYAETLSELATVKTNLSRLERLINDLEAELELAGTSYGIDISAHASKQILERLETLASENNNIYEDVWKPGESLMSPTNMRSFIIGIISQARKNGDYREEKSKSNGIEYHYSIAINKWSMNNKKLVFTGIVENNVIKTGYFNWV